MVAKPQAIGNLPPRAAGWSYLDVFNASPAERIGMIKGGVRARWAKTILHQLALGQGHGLDVLKLSPATVNRKAAADANLSPEEGERVIGMAKLIGQVQAMVEESGNPEGFDAATWLADWLRSPLPAFDGTRPIEFMDTMEGQTMVSNALAQLQSGAYA
jgi:putative toxin-antitoxin system antitoxin component (TIGR02293 family)